jgi:hypothetical protein
MRFFLMMMMIVAMGLCCAMLWSDAPAGGKKALPAAAKGAQGKYEAAVRSAEDVYKKAVGAARQQYVQELDAALKGVMKEGDLDGANTINATVKRLRDELAGPVRDGARLPSGAWTVHYMTGGIQRQFVFEKDGTVIWRDSDKGPEGQGRVVATTTGVFLDLGDKRVDRITVLEDRLLFEHFVDPEKNEDGMPQNMGVARKSKGF